MATFRKVVDADVRPRLAPPAVRRAEHRGRAARLSGRGLQSTIAFAGLPTAVAPSGTSVRTTEFAAIIAPVPIRDLAEDLGAGADPRPQADVGALVGGADQPDRHPGRDHRAIADPDEAVDDDLPVRDVDAGLHQVTGSPIETAAGPAGDPLEQMGEQGDAERLQPGVEPVGGQGEEGIGHEHQAQRREQAVELRVEPEALTPVGARRPGVRDAAPRGTAGGACGRSWRLTGSRFGAVAGDRAEADHQTKGIWSSGYREGAKNQVSSA